MDCRKRFTVESLTDDLLVEILCRVPFKSFCRFKCVCKAWLAFSSDPHYQQKLPKVPTGLLFRHGSSTELACLSPNDEEIDGALTFVPHHGNLELVDSCNGLVLCKYSSPFPDICRFIVCNPATRAWRLLPATHPDPSGPECKAILAFDPAWSAHFYVFNFQEKVTQQGWRVGVSKLEVFSSDLSTWHVDNHWPAVILDDKPHIFIGGVLHVQKGFPEILVLEGWQDMGYRIPQHDFRIKLPANRYSLVDGCFGQSSGVLQYCTFLEEGCRRVAVRTLDAYRPCKWSLKHDHSMQDAFGRDYFDRIGDGYLFLGLGGYLILALDLERELIFLADGEANKILSYNIKSGKLTEIHYGCPGWKYYYYAGCHLKLPS